MKGPVTSHRESCLHQARVYLQQAREFRLRRATVADYADMIQGGYVSRNNRE